MTDVPTSRPQRQISVLAALIVAISTPATLALSWYRLTGDPAFQPLALSVERLAAVGIETGAPMARATIRTDGSERALARAELLGRRIHAAFYGKGVDATVAFVTEPGAGAIEVTYFVGKNSFGPFSVAEATHGIHDCMQAITLARRQQASDRRHSW